MQFEQYKVEIICKRVIKEFKNRIRVEFSTKFTVKSELLEARRELIHCLNILLNAKACKLGYFFLVRDIKSSKTETRY